MQTVFKYMVGTTTLLEVSISAISFPNETPNTFILMLPGGIIPDGLIKHLDELGLQPFVTPNNNIVIVVNTGSWMVMY